MLEELVQFRLSAILSFQPGLGLARKSMPDVLSDPEVVPYRKLDKGQVKEPKREIRQKERYFYDPN
jgi:hypothetical protein